MAYYDHAVMMHYQLGVWEMDRFTHSRETQEGAWAVICRWFGR